MTNLANRLRELHDARFKEFESEVIRQKSLSDRAAKSEQSREKRRREFLQGIGINVANLDKERAKEERTQEKELKTFLDEFKPPAASRRGMGAADAREAAIRTAVLAENKLMVLPVFASSLFAADRATIAEIPGEADGGAITSGWVFPDEPGRIRIKDSGHVAAWCFQAVASAAPPEFAAHFAFVPAITANYEMTAVIAFHGFYVLRSDDGYLSCRYAQVKLKVQMNANQYVDIGWKDFPALIDRKEDNAEEVTTYDRTHFFDYTTVLKAGDPVVVTVKGTVDAFARGGGAYAELNFEAGSANYIEPLLLSVQPV